MTQHIDVRSNGTDRTASTRRGVYRLTMSSLKRIVTLSKKARQLAPYWGKSLITTTEYTM